MDPELIAVCRQIVEFDDRMQAGSIGLVPLKREGEYVWPKLALQEYFLTILFVGDPRTVTKQVFKLLKHYQGLYL